MILVVYMRCYLYITGCIFPALPSNVQFWLLFNGCQIWPLLVRSAKRLWCLLVKTIRPTQKMQSIERQLSHICGLTLNEVDLCFWQVEVYSRDSINPFKSRHELTFSKQIFSYDY